MEPMDQRSRENDVLEAQLFCLLRMLQEVSAWLQDGASERDEKGRKRDGLGCHANPAPSMVFDPCSIEICRGLMPKRCQG